jgi:hypothetical protein
VRLRRATGIETALFESVTDDSRRHERWLSRENLGGATDLAERNRLLLRAVQATTPRRQTTSAPRRIGISPTASCAWPICRLVPSSASAATSTCCGGKRDRLCSRWSHCSAANDSRSVQPFHSRFGGANPMPCPTSSDDHSQGQRRTSAVFCSLSAGPLDGRISATSL